MFNVHKLVARLTHVLIIPEKKKKKKRKEKE